MTMEKQVVTIIVPIYKVEKYIDECIKSIVQQSYNDLEIILVDDGSPDKCGEICDCWAQRDKRIVVLHKKNGGLSDARNYGLDIARGEYILFVDGDDWIQTDLVEKCVRLINETDADFVAFGFQKMGNQGETEENKDRNSVLSYSGKEIIKVGVKYLTFGVSACNKLYRKELWENTRFPVGLLHEDYYVFSEILLKSRLCVLTNQKLYFYRTNQDGIMLNMSMKNHYDLLKAKYHTMECMQDEETYYIALKTFLDELITIYRYETKERKKEIYNIYMEIREYSKRYMTLKTRIVIWLFSFSPKLYFLVWSIRVKGYETYHKLCNKQNLKRRK